MNYTTVFYRKIIVESSTDIVLNLRRYGPGVGKNTGVKTTTLRQADRSIRATFHAIF